MQKSKRRKIFKKKFRHSLIVRIENIQKEGKRRKEEIGEKV